MDKKTQALKLALEALSDFDYDKRQAAITALRTAIEQAEKQEPVTKEGQLRSMKNELWNTTPPAAPAQPFDHQQAANAALRAAMNRSFSIAKHAIPAAPVQEPLATVKESLQVEQLLYDMLDTLPYNSPEYWIDRIKKCYPLYTTPPEAPVQEPVIPEGVLAAIRNAGLTLLKTQHGYQLQKFGQIEAQTAALIDENQRLRAELKFNTPPAAQRPWIGLTDEEAIQVAIEIDIEFKDEGREQQEDDIQTFARAIEAKLKEKNT